MPSPDRSGLKKGALFNATGPLFEKGQGTLIYRGVWNLFDQMIFPNPYLSKKKANLSILILPISLKRNFCFSRKADTRGYTWRTYVGNNYHGGFSDHLPVYIILKKK
jgi:hypothetical protein